MAKNESYWILQRESLPQIPSAVELRDTYARELGAPSLVDLRGTDARGGMPSRPSPLLWTKLLILDNIGKKNMFLFLIK